MLTPFKLPIEPETALRIQEFRETTSLAKLMTMAIDDMEALIDDELYLFDSSCWQMVYDQTSHNECFVCTGGAVMAHRLGTDTSRRVLPMDFDYDISERLYAINRLRLGQFYSAYKSSGFCIHVEDVLFKNSHLTPWCYDFYSREMAKGFIKFWRFKGLAVLKEIEGID